MAKSPTVTSCRMRGAYSLVVGQRSRSGGELVVILSQPWWAVKLNIDPPAGSTVVHLLSDDVVLNSSLKGVELEETVGALIIRVAESKRIGTMRRGRILFLISLNRFLNDFDLILLILVPFL